MHNFVLFVCLPDEWFLHDLVLGVNPLFILLLVFLLGDVCWAHIRLGLPLEFCSVQACFAVYYDLFEHELLQVELLREFQPLVYLHAPEGFEVDVKSLQMHYESIWQPFQGHFPFTLDLFVAGAALVLLDDLASNHALQRPYKGAPVFDLQAQTVEIFWGSDDIAAAFADSESRSLALERALYEILLRSVFQRSLKAVEAEIDALLGVLLGPHTRGPPAEVFEGVAEVCWRILLSVAHLEERE